MTVRKIIFGLSCVIAIFVCQYAHANIPALIAKCERFVEQDKWTEYDATYNLVTDAVNKIGADFREPYLKNLDELTIKACLAKRQYVHLYAYLFDTLQPYYKSLRYADKRDENALYFALLSPLTDLRPYAALHDQHIIGTLYALAEYYFYTKQLDKAADLTSVILNLEQSLKPRAHFYPQDKRVVLKAKLLNAEIKALRGFSFDAAIAYKALISKSQQERSAEIGYAYLGLARCAIDVHEFNKAEEMIASAGAYFKDIKRGQAYRNLVQAELYMKMKSSLSKAHSLIWSAESYFFGHEDPYGRGLAMLKLYKLSQLQHESYDHYRLACDIAQKKTLPLLASLIEGKIVDNEPLATELSEGLESNEEAPIIHDDQGDDLKPYSYVQEATDPLDEPENVVRKLLFSGPQASDFVNPKKRKTAQQIDRVIKKNRKRGRISFFSQPREDFPATQKIPETQDAPQFCQKAWQEIKGCTKSGESPDVNILSLGI